MMGSWDEKSRGRGGGGRRGEGGRQMERKGSMGGGGVLGVRREGRAGDWNLRM